MKLIDILKEHNHLIFEGNLPDLSEFSDNFDYLYRQCKSIYAKNHRNFQKLADLQNSVKDITKKLKKIPIRTFVFLDVDWYDGRTKASVRLFAGVSYQDLMSAYPKEVEQFREKYPYDKRDAIRTFGGLKLQDFFKKINLEKEGGIHSIENSKIIMMGNVITFQIRTIEIN